MRYHGAMGERMRVLIAAIVVAAAGVGAADDVRPRVGMEATRFEFGTVERGMHVEHTFGLPNRGTATLRIEQVKSSCGCTVAVISDRDVPPGREGRVAVTLDTARLAGPTTKVVNVYTNDPDLPVIGLTLAGQVAADLVVSPNPVYLGRVRRGEPARREVLVTPGREGAAYTVVRIEHPNPALHATVETRADGPGQRVVLTLDPDMPLGRFNEQVVLHTTSPRDPVITVPVFGSIEGDVVVLPPQVTFGTTGGHSAAERELYVRNRGTRPVAVTRVAVPEEIVSYALSPVQEGLEYRITLRLRDGLRPGKLEGAVEIFTDHPDERHLVVPLYAIVRDGRRRG